MDIVVFLPCRSGSQRVKNKNIRSFSKYKFGLFQLKIEQLLKVKDLNKIIVSTDDKKILNYLKKKNYRKINIDKRPKIYASNKTKTDELIRYSSRLFNNKDHILWTHVTSPLFDSEDYTKAIKTYKRRIKKYDTLIGVNIIQDFIFNKKSPINYNYKKTYWPNTQSLRQLYKINNTFFLTSAKNYKKRKNRIGSKILFYNVEKIKSIDIDDKEDFKLAEKIFSIKNK